MMDFEILEISNLAGLDRNKATGDDPDGAFVPDEIYNLVPTKRGAWTPLGKATALPGAISLPSQYLGFDQGGLASFDSGALGYKVFDGDAVASSVATYANLANTAHIPKFGAYRSRTQFFGRDNSDPRIYFEPFDIAPTVTPSSTSASDEITVDCAGQNIEGVAFAAGVGPAGEDVFVVATQSGDIWSGEGLTDLTRRVDQAWAYRNVRWCGDRFVAVGDNGVAAYSTDGHTWTQVSAAGWTLRDVVHDAPRNAIIAVGDVVVRSIDGGATWTQVDDAQVSVFQNMDLQGVAIDDAGLLVAVPLAATTYFGSWAFETSADGISWTNRTGARGNSVAYAGGVWVSVFGGTVLTSPDGFNWIVVTNNLTGGPSLSRVVANDDVFVAVGAGGKVYKSADGANWEAIPAPGLTNWQDVISLDDGTVVVVGDGGKAFMVNASTGLKAGTYTVYWATSVSTDAGLLVVTLGSKKFVLAGEAGNSIDVTIPDTATIKTNNGSPAWMTTAFLENNVFVDIYLASTVGVTGDEETEDEADPLANTSAVFDFTLRPGGTLTDTIDAIPIGRILGGGQGIMTVAFDDPDTALHRERVWGLFSGEEGLYTKGDASTEVEISSLAGGFAIGYTDIGYANLARQGNYIPLAPGESEEFVGLVSTPSGLLVFFTNEVFLISGDPLLDSLSAELYPAIVGADVGTRPVKLGGVAFSIWKGRVYALQGGQAQHISRPADDRDDPFIELTPEPATTSLLARTFSGAVYRFMVEDGFWLLNTISDADYILPHPDDLGSRYYIVDSLQYVERDLGPSGIPDTPYVIYRDIDYGAKSRLDSTYRVEVPTTDYAVETNAAELDYVADSVPQLFFKILENDSEVDNAASTDVVAGRLYGHVYRFTLPRKRRSRMADFKLNFRGMKYGSTIEPQILIHYVPGAIRSRRVKNV